MVEKRQQSQHARETEIRSETEQQRSELQEQLREERTTMSNLVQENRDLQQKLRALEAENAQLRQSTVELTTTDLMNRQALLQYLEHINAHNPALPSGTGGSSSTLVLPNAAQARKPSMLEVVMGTASLSSISGMNHKGTLEEAELDGESDRAEEDDEIWE